MLSDITKVQVFVKDINDNPPFFNQSLFSGEVRESADIGQNVLKIKAHDRDKGELVIMYNYFKGQLLIPTTDQSF